MARWPLFPVTVVGSWPRPPWLLEAMKRGRSDLRTLQERGDAPGHQISGRCGCRYRLGWRAAARQFLLVHLPPPRRHPLDDHGRTLGIC